MNEIKKAFGKRLKYLRELKGLTQENLAELLEINCRSLSFIECGVNFVSAQTLFKLCVALDVTPKQMFDFEFKPNNIEATLENVVDLISKNPDKIEFISKLIKVVVD
ncbi:MAG: helix-turn-helix transcriptional regulator [Candidatus Gastranaerophilales bacterium]